MTCPRQTLKGMGSPSQGPSPYHSGAAHVMNQIMTLNVGPGLTLCSTSLMTRIGARSEGLRMGAQEMSPMH
jgi:hypothetical protein